MRCDLNASSTRRSTSRSRLRPTCRRLSSSSDGLVNLSEYVTCRGLSFVTSASAARLNYPNSIENTQAVILPTSIFLTNRKGYPALSQRHQKLMMQLFRYNIQYYLSGRARHRGRFLPYVQYMHFLYGKREAVSAFETPYLDYLQAPLQPLMDNLESQTYETFEQDAFKYDQYERAIMQALVQTPEDKVSVVMVVGAGRGPIVRCALRAAGLANRKTRTFAVEKNPNAVVTLRNLKISEKWDNVTIIASDMRHWKTDEKVRRIKFS